MFIAVLIALLAMSGVAGQASRGVAQADAYSLLISTAACSTDGEGTPLLCEPLDGLNVTVVSDAGEAYGSCVTEPTEVTGGISGQCSVDVPYESTGIVELDETGVPAGNVVLTNPLTFTAPSADEFVPDTDIATIRFTIVRDDEDTSSLGSETLAIGATICAGEEPDAGAGTDIACEPFADATVTVTDEDGEVIGSCVLERYDAPQGSGANCAVSVPFNATYAITLDEAAIPEGYAPAENPISFTAGNYESGGGDGPDVSFRLFLAPDAEEGASPNSSADASVDASAAPGAAGTGSPAAIYAGDCDIDFNDAEAVAVLSEVTEPTGETQGADDTSAVETSFTTLDLPLDDILAEDHVLVVFDEDDDMAALACGAIGGIVSDDGALTFGLPAVGESRFSGIAYLTEDGDQTLATIFLAEDVSATTPEA